MSADAEEGQDGSTTWEKEHHMGEGTLPLDPLLLAALLPPA